MDPQFRGVLSGLIQMVLAATLLFFSLRLLWSDLNRPESEPDPFQLFIDRHGPPWLRRIFEYPLYPDEVVIISVLIAAATFGAFKWLIDFVFG